MYNIKQITNFDIINAPEEIKYVVAGGDIGYDIHGYKTVIYKILSSAYLKNNINKFGYCCEPKALQYPIFLTIIDEQVETEKEFQIGKTGMFELQPEMWKNVNDPSSQEQESNVLISRIKVPWYWKEKSTDTPEENYKGFNFKLDFIYSAT